jgi:hypothetical protein
MEMKKEKAELKEVAGKKGIKLGSSKKREVRDFKAASCLCLPWLT